MTSRRAFLTGFGSLIAAPAIVCVQNIMPVRGIIMPMTPFPIPPPSQLLIDLFAAMEQMRENTRRLYAMPPIVAFKNSFENGVFVSRAISAAEFYK